MIDCPIKIKRQIMDLGVLNKTQHSFKQRQEVVLAKTCCWKRNILCKDTDDKKAADISIKRVFSVMLGSPFGLIPL